MRKFLKQFGGKATDEWIDRYNKSPNWRNGQFQNLEETDMSINFLDVPKIFYEQLANCKNRSPKSKIPILPFDERSFLEKNTDPKFVWYGHSALLLNVDGKIIFIDPMMGPDAAPIAPVETARFSQRTLDILEGIPELDLVIISHDHYDHLDMDSILKLKSRCKAYLVGLGIKRHLVAWGVQEHLITEIDWWEEYVLDDLLITYTPTRHFSGRGLTDRAKSLWGGWVLKSHAKKIWFSGDGGYGEHFKEIGNRLGPFDFAFMECGQYDEKWSLIHMFPNESVQAALDAGVKRAMPVHWGGFSLSSHSWTDPANDFILAAQKGGLEYVTPRIGSVCCLSIKDTQEWWKE